MSYIHHKLRHMCNMHIKETEISQKRSKGIKNWKITYSVILSVLSNKTNLILGFSSPSREFRKLIWKSKKKALFNNTKHAEWFLPSCMASKVRIQCFVKIWCITNESQNLSASGIIKTCISNHHNYDLWRVLKTDSFLLE